MTARQIKRETCAEAAKSLFFSAMDGWGSSDPRKQKAVMDLVGELLRRGGKTDEYLSASEEY